MKKILLFMILLPWLQTSCNKCKDIECTSPPAVFLFKIVDKNSKNITSSITTMALKYTDKGLTKETKLQKIVGNSQDLVFSTNELGWISSSSSDEMAFDLVLDEKVTGKLVCKVVQKSENCCSFFETEKMTFNGKSVFGKKDKDYSYLLLLE